MTDSIGALVLMSKSVPKHWRYPSKLIELAEAKAEEAGIDCQTLIKLLLWLYIRGEIDVDIKQIVEERGLA